MELQTGGYVAVAPDGKFCVLTYVWGPLRRVAKSRVGLSDFVKISTYDIDSGERHSIKNIETPRQLVDQNQRMVCKMMVYHDFLLVCRRVLNPDYSGEGLDVYTLNRTADLELIHFFPCFDNGKRPDNFDAF